MAELTTDDLTPRERVALFAACAQEDRDDERQVIHDPAYMPECEHLTELGLFEAVYVAFADGQAQLAGYRLSRDAALAHNVQREIEDAQGSVN